jgi:GT2 family glycosyltransferase
VRLIRNETNVGFARGVNQGLAATTAPYVLIMNPDCRLMAGAIARCEVCSTRSRSVRITGPRVLNPDGSVQGSARGDPDMLTGLFGRTTMLREVAPFLPIGRRNIVVDEAIRSGSRA